MLTEQFTLEPDAVLAHGGLSPEEFQRTGLAWPDVITICRDHVSCTPELRSAGDYILNRLQEVASIHSLKLRIKDPEHLATKIIRRKLDIPTVEVNLSSYRDVITDLIGLRALHLFKDDWKPIHDFVIEQWEQAETPTAYVREGDPEELRCAFLNARCEVKVHPFGYRSVHYLLKSRPAKKTHLVELQVRTIFEEGWSEIDHRVRYPRHSSDRYLADLLRILNRLAGGADELGTFTRALSCFLSNHSAREAEYTKTIASKEEELTRVIAELQISEEQKTQLETRLEALRRPEEPKLETFFSSNVSLTGSLGNHDVPFTPGRFGARSISTCPRCGSAFNYAVYPSQICHSCHLKLP